MRYICRFFYSLMLFMLATTACAVPTFTSGKEFRELSSTTRAAATQLDPNIDEKNTVIEFFNYGCPACFHLEPDLEAWKAKQPNTITLQRIPVTFQPHWELYAKAYYVAEGLGITDKITPLIFDALHKQGADLTNANALAAFFAKQGVDKSQFNRVFQHSPTLTLMLTNGDKLLQLYGINAVPAFVINNRYVTSVEMAGSPKQLFEVINYLLKLKK